MKGSEKMSDNSFKYFPSDSVEALAMLYLSTVDLKGKTPEEIARMYYDAYRKIEAEKNNHVSKVRDYNEEW